MIPTKYLDRQESFKNRMFMVFGFAIAALLLLFASHQYLNSRLLDSIDEARRMDRQLKTLTDLQQSFIEIEEQLNLVASQNLSATNLSNLDRHLQQSQSWLKQLRAEATFETEELEKISAIILELFSHDEDNLSPQKIEKTRQHYRLLKSEIDEKIIQLTLQVREQLKTAYEQVQSEKDRPLQMGIVIVLSLVGIMTFGFRILYGRLQLFLNNMSTATETTQGMSELKTVSTSGYDELSKVEQSFNRMIKKLEESHLAVMQSNRDLESFAAMASHDLQVPLRYISAYTGLITSDQQKLSKDQVQEYSLNIQKSVARLSSLIKNLLEFSRVGSELPALAKVSLGQLLSPVVTELKTISPGLVVEIRDPEIEIECYPVLFQTVFTNLFSNSVKYSGRSDVRIEVQGRSGPASFEILVQDNGPGIPEADKGRIFDLFKRGDRQDDHGDGIGLAVCKKIMSIHSGGIEVVSSEFGLKTRIHRN